MGTRWLPGTPAFMSAATGFFQNREVASMLNPVAGRERQWGAGTLKIVPSHEARRIVVVGGGQTRMRTAAVAARRGHHVTLLEKQESLGGPSI